MCASIELANGKSMARLWSSDSPIRTCDEGTGLSVQQLYVSGVKFVR